MTCTARFRSLEWQRGLFRPRQEKGDVGDLFRIRLFTGDRGSAPNIMIPNIMIPRPDYEKIEKSICESMLASTMPKQQCQTTLRSTVSTLLEQRRNTPSEDTSTRRLLSKQIRTNVRTEKRRKRRFEVNRILSQYRDLRKIAGIKSHRKNELIPDMLDAEGGTQHDRQKIADTFAEFYGQLYRDLQHDSGSNQQNTRADASRARIPEFSIEELRTALWQLKTGRSTDTSGIAAEMLKHGGEPLHDILLMLYSDITNGHAPIPDAGEKTVVKVKHKSGDKRLPQN